VPEVAPPPPNILLVVPVGPNRPGLKEGTCAGVGNSVEGPPEVLGAELPNEKGFAEEAVVPKVAPPPPNILLVVPVGPNRPVVDGVAELRTDVCLFVCFCSFRTYRLGGEDSTCGCYRC